MHTTFIWDIF